MEVMKNSKEAVSNRNPKETASDPGIIVRRARLSDLDALEETERLCFPVPWSRESLRHDIAENPLALVLVAELRSDMTDAAGNHPAEETVNNHTVYAGYADLWLIAGEGQLNNIAVLPSMRRHHAGRALMQALLDYLQEEKAFEMSLEVRVSNEPAIRLYESLGFETAGIRREYYEDNGEDALVMKKALE